MATVAFKKGLLANLPKTYTEGAFYVTTDERAIYLDVDSSTVSALATFRSSQPCKLFRPTPIPALPLCTTSQT